MLQGGNGVGGCGVAGASVTPPAPPAPRPAALAAIQCCHVPQFPLGTQPPPCSPQALPAGAPARRLGEQVVRSKSCQSSPSTCQPAVTVIDEAGAAGAASCVPAAAGRAGGGTPGCRARPRAGEAGGEGQVTHQSRGPGAEELPAGSAEPRGVRPGSRTERWPWGAQRRGRCCCTRAGTWLLPGVFLPLHCPSFLLLLQIPPLSRMHRATPSHTPPAEQGVPRWFPVCPPCTQCTPVLPWQLSRRAERLPCSLAGVSVISAADQRQRVMQLGFPGRRCWALALPPLGTRCCPPPPCISMGLSCGVAGRRELSRVLLLAVMGTWVMLEKQPWG